MEDPNEKHVYVSFESNKSKWRNILYETTSSVVIQYIDYQHKTQFSVKILFGFRRYMTMDKYNCYHSKHVTF